MGKKENLPGAVLLKSQTLAAFASAIERRVPN